jgi:SAM-dependent methyltransferase
MRDTSSLEQVSQSVLPHSAFPGLACPRCHATMASISPDFVECPNCGATYPVLGRVPVIFEYVVPPPKVAYGSEDVARDLLEAFQLPADAIRMLQVRRLIAAQPRFGNALVQAEAAQFLDRVRTSGWSIATELKPKLAEGSVTARDSGPHVRWICEYVPRVIPPGRSFTANVRFRNAGAIRLRHAPPGNFVLAVRWLHADGRPLNDAPDVRTPLPLDIAPGRELTFPMRIEAPRNEGRYRLRLIMVEEGVGWMEADALDIRVTLRPMHWPEVPPGWQFNPEMRLDYGADHVRSLDIMRKWLANLSVRSPRVLEIGGNAYPAIAEIDGELHNADVDLLGLQIGCLVQDRMEPERPGRRVHQLCADADDLPYANSYFDAIVMFATLHHFPDPARTLERLAAKLRPNGFIGLFCEPVGHVHPGAVDPSYLRELERGVNEQSFLMREWADIIRGGGMRVAEALVDGSSLKARLVPTGSGDGVTAP